MKQSDSVTTHLMERTVCDDCGHFHRVVLGTAGRDYQGKYRGPKCECCAADVQGNPQPVQNKRRTRRGRS